jgi:hypothetical protein
MSNEELAKIFEEFYEEKKRRLNLGIPSFANFKVFLQILARELLLMNFNTIFLIKEFRKVRKEMYSLMVELVLENSKPAIEATQNQGQAMEKQTNSSL